MLDLYSLMDFADWYSPDWLSVISPKQKEVVVYLRFSPKDASLSISDLSKKLGVTKQATQSRICSLSGFLKRIFTIAQKKIIKNKQAKTLLTVILFTYQNIDLFVQAYENIKIEYIKTLDLIEINQLVLATRLKNVLFQHNILTIGDVYRNYEKLLDLKGFGKESLKELEQSYRLGFPTVNKRYRK
jgi:hypothetical protein